MKFEVSSSTLLNRLQSISRVIASKSALPILDSFLFHLEGPTLTIVASDVDTRLVTKAEVINAEGGGLFAIQAKMLLDPLRKLPEQPLTFNIDDENMEVVIRFRNGKYNFIGQSGDNYPQQRSLSDSPVALTLESQILLSGVSRALFATADDELRPVMNGIFLDIKPESLTFAASDGHKLVRIKNDSVTSSDAASFILPKKPANLLKSLLVKNEEPVLIEFDTNNAYISTGHFEMICHLIEGKYPNYNSVIPKDNNNKVKIERQAFLSALERVSVFANPASSLVKIDLSSEAIKLSAQDINFATSAEEEVPCEHAGENLSIGFKATSLAEILSNITASDVTLALADPAHPGVVTPVENDEHEDLLMLLMPMVLSE